MFPRQQFSLRWNNYLRHVTNVFDDLRNQEDLVDVTLCCEGKKIRAHKMLLSACSTYFRDIFKENPCQHPVIIFRNVRYDDLFAIINFMYHGEVNIAHEQLASFLTTAELLEVQGLTDDNDDKDQGNTKEPINQEDLCQNTDFEALSNAKKRKLSVKKSSPMASTYWENTAEINVISVNNTENNENLKLEETENFNPESGISIKSNIPSASIISFPEEVEMCDTDVFQNANLLTELKSTGGLSSLNDDPQNVAGDNAETLKEVAQDGDLVKFRCHLCWKGFKHPTSLTLHKDSHTGKTQCPVCHRSFSRSYDMRSHLMKIHQDQSVTDLKSRTTKSSLANST